MSANVLGNNVAPIPESPSDLGEPSWRVMIARAVNLLLKGKVNAVTTLTLNVSATSTTLTDDRVGPASHIALTPLTSSATALDIAPYVSARGKGSATISHGSSPASDLNFSVLILG